MRMLIVGALGYVGGRLANHLRQRHPDAHIRLATKRPRLPLWAATFPVCSLDLSDPASISDCLRDAGIDTVIHLGAVQQRQAQEDPALARDVNVSGTERLLAACREHQVRRFLFFSTFQVYGKVSGRITEDTAPAPNGVYAESKLQAEEVIRTCAGPIEWAIFRLSNAYGPAQDLEAAERVWPLVFNSLCRGAVEEGAARFRSNQYRDFIAMEDVGRAVDHWLCHPGRWPSAVFNLGGECTLSVRQVAEKIAVVYEQRYGRPLEISGPAEDLDTVFEPFVYAIDRLKKTGFTLTGDMETEIDGLFRLCERLKA